MALKLQSINELKTTSEKVLYKKTLDLIYDTIAQNEILKKRNINLDRQRQHKIRISKLIIKGKINPRVKVWLANPTKGDIVSIDDIPQDLIKKLRYGKVLTKSERKILSQLRKINNKRSEKALIKDLMTNENILPISEKEKWLKNPTKYDIKGIDTIPENVAGSTATKISKLYKTTTDKKTHKYTRQTIHKGGYFSHNKLNVENVKKRRIVRINRLLKGSKKANFTIAHEIGHSYDMIKNRFKKPTNKKVIEDMKVIASIPNPPPIPFHEWENNLELQKMASTSIHRFMKYRLSPTELFADSFSYLVYNPSFVKKKAPNLYAYVIKTNPKIKKIIGKERKKLVTKIVKTIKKDKTYLKKERIKRLIQTKRDQIKKLKSRKRIGLKTKQKINKLQTSIKKYRDELK